MVAPPPFERSPETLGVVGACCLRCPDEPCYRFNISEGGGGNTIQVCPVDAIREPRAENGPSISDDCVGCGLCAMRCPVGAIQISPDGTAVVSRPELDLVTQVADESEFLEKRAERTTKVQWSSEVWEHLSGRLAETAADFRQRSFYPLVANLFTAAGHPAWKPPSGDTNNRIDLVLASDLDSLPVEVKSRTESIAINVKSVQQALENRVVLDERQFFAADRASSTLVVGFGYPAPRSDVTELVVDIAKAFDIKIGLISLSDLYVLAMRCQIAGEEIQRSTLSRLCGVLA